MSIDGVSGRTSFIGTGILNLKSQLGDLQTKIQDTNNQIQDAQTQLSQESSARSIQRSFSWCELKVRSCSSIPVPPK